MKTAEVIADLSVQYYVWCGVAGYDTRPYRYRNPNATEDRFQQEAPVEYEIGFADGREGYIQPAGDIAAWIEGTPVGGVIVVPDYSGCHWVGDARYVRTSQDNWEIEDETHTLEQQPGYQSKNKKFNP